MEFSRRRLLQSAAGAFMVPALQQRSTGRDITGRLARYMVESQARTLPPVVLREAKHRVLDTIAAMISGAHLRPGEVAIEFIRTQGGTPEASVLTTNIRTTVTNAALANGMFGHANETDDFEPVTKAHPGCSVVPAALAIAERDGRSGMEFLRAVTLGYDLCCRFLLALGPDHVRGTHRSAEGTSSTFGAAAAAAAMSRFNERQMRFALSYAAQQVSGIWSWARDSEHVEKAFDFGGMGARNGVAAAVMVRAGFTGVEDVLDGEHNMIEALSMEPKPEEMVAALGTRFYVTETAIKTYSVGYPIQAPVDALLVLRRQHGLTPQNVERIVARLPEDGALIVDNRAMPDVNLQYALAVALMDGTVSFEATHSRERMDEAQIKALRSRVQLVADKSLMDPDAPRSGFVEVTLRDGRKVSHFVRHATGTKENPLDTAGVSDKARSLMLPVLGAQRATAVIDRVMALDTLADMRTVLPLLTAM